MDIIIKDTLNSGSGCMGVLGKYFIYTEGYHGAKNQYHIIHIDNKEVQDFGNLSGIYYGNDMVVDEKNSHVYITPGAGNNKVAVLTINKKGKVTSTEYLYLPNVCTFSSIGALYNGILYV